MSRNDLDTERSDRTPHAIMWRRIAKGLGGFFGVDDLNGSESPTWMSAGSLVLAPIAATIWSPYVALEVQGISSVRGPFGITWEDVALETLPPLVILIVLGSVVLWLFRLAVRFARAKTRTDSRLGLTLQAILLFSAALGSFYLPSAFPSFGAFSLVLDWLPAFALLAISAYFFTRASALALWVLMVLPIIPLISVGLHMNASPNGCPEFWTGMAIAPWTILGFGICFATLVGVGCRQATFETADTRRGAIPFLGVLATAMAIGVLILSEVVSHWIQGQWSLIALLIASTALTIVLARNWRRAYTPARRSALGVLTTVPAFLFVCLLLWVFSDHEITDCYVNVNTRLHHLVGVFYW